MPMNSEESALKANDQNEHQAPLIRAVWLGSSLYTPEEAGRNIRELRRGVTLGGLRIKDLIHEGHCY